MLRPAAFLLLAALLLCPIAVPAQTPVAAKAAPRLVSIRVAFVAATVTDIDALGINFNLLPLPAPPHTFLKYTTGNIALQLYQVLTRSGSGQGDRFVTTPDNIAATITGPQRLIQGDLTFIPHLGPSNAVRLDILPLETAGKPIILPAVSSGETIVLITPNHQGTNEPISGGLFRVPDKLPATQELLIFITPTVLANPPVQTSVPEPEKTIYLDVSNCDLHTVVTMLAHQNGILALVQDGTEPYQPVFVHLQGVALSKALRAVAFSAGATVTKNADGVYVFAPAEIAHRFTEAQLPSTPKAPINQADLKWHTIALQHAKPSEVLKFMHWDGAGANLNLTDAARNPNLPAGTEHIFALQSNNSLLVQATEDGFNLLKNVVKILDIIPRQVEIKVLFAAIPTSQKMAVDMTNPTQALLQLHTANAVFYQPPQVTTDNGVLAGFPLEEWRLLEQAVLDRGRIKGNVGWITQSNILTTMPTLHVTPRINSDNSVTINMNFGELAATDAPEGPPQILTMLRTTVPSSEAAVYDVTQQLPPCGNRVFLFVTPTTLSASTNNDNITVKP